MGKSVFVDRDGSICKEHYGTYVGSWDMFEFLPGVKEAFRRLRKAEFDVFVISNQAGINKGIITQKAVWSVTDRMVAEICEAGGQVKDVLYCPHRIEERCSCRKPAPGLILTLAERHGVDLAESWMIGDLVMDVQAGKAAGCKTIILMSGRPKTDQDWQQLKNMNSPDFVAEDLLDAVNHVIGGKKCSRLTTTLKS